LDVWFEHNGVSVSYFALDQEVFQRRSGLYGNMFIPEKLGNAIDRISADIQIHYGPFLAGEQEAWTSVARVLAEPPPKRGFV
jgi:hypothetical protein